jgi:hypothetical protein
MPAVRRRPRWLMPLILAVVGLLVLCGVFGGIAYFAANSLTQGMASTGETFMADLRDAKYPEAYNLLTPEFQQQIGSVDKFAGGMEAVHPASWTFTSRQVQNNSGQLDGTAKMTDGTEATLQLVLDQVGGAWKVSGINIQPK